ncbi:hypothetical protein C475_00652 [Halosimplex carlsbadense 2-9-1]|uniref:Uncharacterized protein n=1 Tax=Halosimplex carlsbadense 2-9-1 TaxID=797114 RepID=M0D7R7_9EURY|nr:hypothetical protein [Halosimplex carlsbadense]ELZ30199.1 hypothetical protein C475_00652 [Halosimplex carlsbadense 2-9-1]
MKRKTLIASLCVAALALGGASVAAADLGTPDRPVAQHHDDTSDITVEVVDPDGELTADERERTRSLVREADDAVASLAERFEAGTVTLSVSGVDPSDRVHMDANAPDGGPETVVVADLAEESVRVEDGTLIDDSEIVSQTVDSDNVTLVDGDRSAN